jgi:AcrR family transcriptional regulator
MPLPLTPKKRLPTHSRKQRIVETVLELVATHGTEAVSAQLVADAIGVTQPAVFRHFSTKEAMWLAVMDWLEERLVAIYSTANDEADEPGLSVLSRMFLGHVKLIADYPALAKLVFADHLRLQYPSLQARFERIHNAYTARLSAVIERAKSDGTVYHSVASKDAATMFLSLLQGLGFQFSIARLPMKFLPEAERVFVIYLQGITAPADSRERARRTVETAKNRQKSRGQVT